MTTYYAEWAASLTLSDSNSLELERQYREFVFNDPDAVEFLAEVDALARLEAEVE